MNEEFIQSFREPVTYNNWFKDLNPLSKFDILLVTALSALIVDKIVYSVALCAAYIIMALLIGEFKYFWSIFWKVLFTMGFFIIIIREISVKGETVLFSIFGWKWTLEGLMNGLEIGTKLIAFSGAVILFYASTKTKDLMLALEGLGVPHTTSYIMLSSFQTITDLRKSVNTIYESQKARGIEVEGNMIVRAKAFFPIISPLLIGAMSAAEEKSIAMDARAFSYDAKHTYLRELRKVPTGEKILVIFADVIFVLIIVAKILKWL